MQLQLSAPKIWMATEAVDFRKGVNSLCGYIVTHNRPSLEDHIYIFYNRARNKLKLVARHHNGFVLVYKCLDKKKFIIKRNESDFYELNEKQLSWLLGGLDWVEMSGMNEVKFDDYF